MVVVAVSIEVESIIHSEGHVSVVLLVGLHVVIAVFGRHTEPLLHWWFELAALLVKLYLFNSSHLSAELTLLPVFPLQETVVVYINNKRVRVS